MFRSKRQKTEENFVMRSSIMCTFTKYYDGEDMGLDEK
jgi:hypothetical protein